MAMKVPEAVIRVIRKLQEAGFEAYVVGGAVRDWLLGLEPHDWDVATSALPEQVMALFERTVPTGLKFGTVTVVLDRPIEVTTFRREGPYLDGRRPQEVQLGVSLEEDLSRRDFTVNAMAYDPIRDIYVDPYGAKDQLLRRKVVIQTVGPPKRTFDDDALRLLRTFSLWAKLYPHVEEVSIAPEVEEAIRSQAQGLKRISVERIQQELNKIMLSPVPHLCLEQMAQLALLPQFWPELCRKQGEKQALVLKKPEMIPCLRPQLDLRLAALFFGVEGSASERASLARTLLARLRYAKDLTGLVVRLLEHSAFDYPRDRAGVRKLIQKVGREEILLLLELREAELKGEEGAERELLRKLKATVEEILRAGDPLTVRELEISGRDLINHWGLTPGPLIGKVLNQLLELVLEDPRLNEREKLLEAAGAILRKLKTP